jgi:hypothetical protein
MQTKLKVLLSLTILSFCSLSHAISLTDAKKLSVVSDDYILANINSIKAKYNAECVLRDSENVVSLYDRRSLITGVDSNDNFDLSLNCTQVDFYSPLPVLVEVLGHFSYDNAKKASVVLDAIITSTPGFNNSRVNKIPLIPRE